MGIVWDKNETLGPIPAEVTGMGELYQLTLLTLGIPAWDLVPRRSLGSSELLGLMAVFGFLCGNILAVCLRGTETETEIWGAPTLWITPKGP